MALVKIISLKRCYLCLPWTEFTQTPMVLIGESGDQILVFFFLFFGFFFFFFDLNNSIFPANLKKTQPNKKNFDKYLFWYTIYISYGPWSEAHRHWCMQNISWSTNILKSDINSQPFQVLLLIPTFVAKTRTCWQKLSDLRVKANIGMFYQLTSLSMLILTGHAESKTSSFPSISAPCWHLNFVMKHSCDNFCKLVSFGGRHWLFPISTKLFMVLSLFPLS